MFSNELEVRSEVKISTDDNFSLTFSSGYLVITDNLIVWRAFYELNILQLNLFHFITFRFVRDKASCVEFV